VAAKGAKAGLMLYEVKRTAATIADVLRGDEPVAEPASEPEQDAFEALAAMTPTTPAYAPLGTRPENNGSAWA
jgi:hypothetical protein